LAGCTESKGTPEAQPDAAPILAKAGQSTRAATSVHFVVDVQGTIAGLPLRKADGRLTREGKAKGTATLDQEGTILQIDFVLVDQKLYYKGPTGSTWTAVPASVAGSVYDPAAILDPERGLAKLLGTARDFKQVGTEDIDGVKCVKITGTIAKDRIVPILPGVTQDAAATLWLTDDDAKLPRQAEFVIAGTTVKITTSDWNEAVTITAPK